MKRIWIILLVPFVSCSESEVKENSERLDKLEQSIEEDEEKEPEAEQEEIVIYQSDDMNVTEYLKSIRMNGQPTQWYYYNKRNMTEIELGVMNHRGMEMIYFKNRPDVIYDMLDSECGFKLEENDEISQWYEQIEPACDVN